MDPRFNVELVTVTKRYGETLAVDSISLRIPRATYCCLLGPSGCGKTTLLRCIAGLISPSKGRIQAGDRLFYDAATAIGLPTRQRNLGMVFQASALWPLTRAGSSGRSLRRY